MESLQLGEHQKAPLPIKLKVLGLISRPVTSQIEQAKCCPIPLQRFFVRNSVVMEQQSEIRPAYLLPGLDPFIFF